MTTFHSSLGKPDPVFIAISGLIGAGKSTLATALGKELGLPVYYEPVKDNEYLEDFYGDMSKYAFPMQVYLLNKRFKQHQEIIWRGEGGVQDRSIYEDTIFARVLVEGGHMTERDGETYKSLFTHMSHFMRRPDIIVHLDVSPEESLERIKMRSRGCESGISIEYLRALHAAYEEFIDDISRTIPVIKVNWSEYKTVEEVAAKVKSEYRAARNIRHVMWEESESEPEAEVGGRSVGRGDGSPTQTPIKTRPTELDHPPQTPSPTRS
jgi:deoxyadenosine kinase